MNRLPYRLHMALMASMLALPLLPMTSAVAKKPRAPVASASAPIQAASGPSKGKEILSINDADPGMQAAFKKAQNTLDDFLAVVKSQNPKITNMAIKIFVTDGKLTDYVWMQPFAQTAKGFKGEVNNVSGIIKGLEVGQELDFTRADIVDWMYVNTEDNTMHGNFTTCAMMVNSPPSELAEMKTKYGLDCSAAIKP